MKNGENDVKMKTLYPCGSYQTIAGATPGFPAGIHLAGLDGEQSGEQYGRVPLEHRLTI